jgi:hypothetical protein
LSLRYFFEIFDETLPKEDKADRIHAQIEKAHRLLYPIFFPDDDEDEPPEEVWTEILLVL